MWGKLPHYSSLLVGDSSLAHSRDRESKDNLRQYGLLSYLSVPARQFSISFVLLSFLKIANEHPQRYGHENAREPPPVTTSAQDTNASPSKVDAPVKMAEDNPELQAALRELDRELEVSFPVSRSANFVSSRGRRF